MPMPKPLRDAIKDAIIARINDDNDKVERAVRQVLQYGRPGMFAACGGWAAACVAFIFDERPSDGVLTFKAHDVESGERVEPQDMPAEAQGHIWAARFIAAVDNEDMDTAYALFKVAEDDDGPVGSGPWVLLDMAADVVGAKMAEAAFESIGSAVAEWLEHITGKADLN